MRSPLSSSLYIMLSGVQCGSLCIKRSGTVGISNVCVSCHSMTKSLLNCGDNILDVKPLEVIQLELDLEADASIIDHFLASSMTLSCWSIPPQSMDLCTAIGPLPSLLWWTCTDQGTLYSPTGLRVMPAIFLTKNHFSLPRYCLCLYRQLPLIDTPTVNGPSYCYWSPTLPVMANLYCPGRALLSHRPDNNAHCHDRDNLLTHYPIVQLHPRGHRPPYCTFSPFLFIHVCPCVLTDRWSYCPVGCLFMIS